jgi:hypothetical protein
MPRFPIYELEDEYSLIIVAFVILILSVIFGVNNLLAIAIIVFVIYIIAIELVMPRPRKRSAPRRR